MEDGGWRDERMGDGGMEKWGDGGMRGWRDEGQSQTSAAVLFEMPGPILHSVGGNNRATIQRESLSLKRSKRNTSDPWWQERRFRKSFHRWECRPVRTDRTDGQTEDFSLGNRRQTI